MRDYAKKSLEGLWVGDCVGNLGQLYFAHDILKALSEGVAKYGGMLEQYRNQFQYSDDTEEAIVLYNQLRELEDKVLNSDEFKSDKARLAKERPDFDEDTLNEFSFGEIFRGKPIIDQDQLAMGFATRYMTRDPDGEIYGYGLNTRKVLRDIYEGVPWRQANKFIKKSEGMPSHIDSLVDSLAQGKNFKAAIHEVNLVLEKARKEDMDKPLVGSCGNGSAMRVAPLGAFLAPYYHNSEDCWSEGPKLVYPEKRVVAEAALQAEVTHCHPEGIAGAIAIAILAQKVTEYAMDPDQNEYGFGYPTFDRVLFQDLLRCTPKGQVWDGIARARDLSYDTPIGKARQILGNGTHVTCQDTVPLCCWLAIKHLKVNAKSPDLYEKAIIETSMAFGDVDTNCAIVGGVVGIACPPPEKWVQFCQKMDGVVPSHYSFRFNLADMVEDVDYPIRSSDVKV